MTGVFILIFCVNILAVSSQVVPLTREDVEITCDPLVAKGTSVICTPPLRGSSVVVADCTQPSIPGTIASFACWGPRREVMRGILNCTEDGIWISSLRAANNSLCNLDAAIINIQIPQVAVASGSPGFTTPSPDFTLAQQDISRFTDFQKVALQLTNTFRRNHGVPFVTMAPLMNDAAQELVDFIAFGKESEIDASKRLALLNVTLNIEMNWYLQQPPSENRVEAVSNAIQSWYATGFSDYDWNNVENNLEKGNALSFARIIWKNTMFIGVGVTDFNGVTFVTCIYTPGRHVGSIDPVLEFQNNVLPIRVGRG